MPVPCPYCGVPSDLPPEFHPIRKSLSMAERIFFDLLWRRSPGYVTRREIHDAYAHFETEQSDNSLPTHVHRINKRLGGLGKIENRFGKGWYLVPANYDRSRML